MIADRSIVAVFTYFAYQHELLLLTNMTSLNKRLEVRMFIDVEYLLRCVRTDMDSDNENEFWQRCEKKDPA